MKMEAHYSIGEAARLCGVTVKQIRNWELMKHIPKPQRVVCGLRSYRQYRDPDLKRIKAIKAYLREGFGLPTAARKAAEDIDNERG